MSDDKPDIKKRRYQEKFKLKQLEMKEKNKQTMCYVNLIATIVTIGLAVGTLVVLNQEKGKCSDSNLRLTLWLMLAMHGTNIIEQVCSMTGLDRICCGCICIIGFFFYEIAVLVYMQSIFYSAGHCEQETPKQYWWLLFNIIVYFAFLAITVFFHIRSLCASVSKDEVEKELKEDEKEDQNATRGNTMQ